MTKRGRGQRRSRRLKNRSTPPIQWITVATHGPSLLAELLAWHRSFWGLA